jgi:hypothetical protein
MRSVVMLCLWIIVLRVSYSVAERQQNTIQSDRHDGWGSKHLWNVGKLLPDYTA